MSNPDQDEMVYGKCDSCDRMRSVDRYTYVCDSCVRAENDRFEAEYTARGLAAEQAVREVMIKHNLPHA